MDQMIDLYGEQFPGEKVYLHFDKGSYLPGETIWFKAYIFEENEPTARSTNLYVSLYDENGKALQQKFYPIINSSTEGHFDIPDTIRSNQLICRAYTGWMMNFDEDFLFTRTIPLLDGRLRPSNPLPATDFKLVFFPEGGDIIEGEKNNIAFLATNGRGLPIPVNGVVKMPDSTTIVTTFQSIHDGMGRFELDQKPGEPYYAEWKDPDGQWHRTALPAPRSMGVSLRMVQQRSGLVYHVVNKLATDQLHVLAYMYQKVIYKSDLPLTAGDRYTGFIPLDSFPSGVLQLTVFNDQWLPVAERVCFIRNNRFRQPVSINYKK
ncbi:MAG: hypothetical protein IPI66_07260 [Chitinophagaceae bacterium]|nr:hypothetical protein [Chitinophagaceae bacterium]